MQEKCGTAGRKTTLPARNFQLAQSPGALYNARHGRLTIPRRPRTEKITLPMSPVPTPLHRRTFTIAFLGSLCMLGLVLWPFWNQIFLAFFLASILHPFYLRLTTRVRPWLASGLICTLIALGVFAPLFSIITAIAAEIPPVIQLAIKNDLLAVLQQQLQDSPLLSRIGALLAEFGINPDLADLQGLISRSLSALGLFAYRQASALAADVLRFVFQSGILIMTLFVLLIEFRRLGAFLLDLSPLPDEHNQHLVDRFSPIAGAILVGNTLSGLLQGVLGGTFFVVMGLISPVLWGVVMGVLAFLPILGVGLVLLPTALILLIKGQIWQAGVTCVFYLFLTVFIEYGFKPRFVGSQAELPPLLVLLSILGGLSLFGIMGIVYGPLAVSAFLTLADMYFRDYQPCFERRPPSGDTRPPP